MDLRIALAPIYAMLLAGACIAAFVLARRDARSRLEGRPFVWIALGVGVVLAVASRLGAAAPVLMSFATAERLFGIALAIAAAGLASVAARVGRRADLLLSKAAVGVDDALARVRRGELLEGILEGRLCSELPTQSPGGVRCAMYEAEVRHPVSSQRPGPLVSRERMAPELLSLRGRTGALHVPGGYITLDAPLEVRSCATDPGGVAPLSFERVARDRAPCRVVGRIISGPSPGTYELRPLRGGQLLVVLGDDLAALGRRMRARALWQFALAALLCVASAWLVR